MELVSSSTSLKASRRVENIRNRAKYMRLGVEKNKILGVIDVVERFEIMLRC